MEQKLEFIMNEMNNINYGFVDNNENIYPDNDENWDNSFSKTYFLQPPKLLLKTKCGVCWDQVELERYYFEKSGIESDSYFIVNYDGKIYPTHTFMIVKSANEYYWFEHSWEPYRGILKFSTLDEVLKDIKLKFNSMLKNKYNIDNNNTIIYKYEKPQYNITCEKFYEHCENGEKININ